jgi:hypothetical protein
MTGDSPDHADDAHAETGAATGPGRPSHRHRAAGAIPAVHDAGPDPLRDADTGLRSPYDSDTDAREDAPWFAAPPEDDPDADRPAGRAALPPWAQPGPRAAARIAPDDWAGAEAGLAAALAQAALAVGALDDRVRSAGGAAPASAAPGRPHAPQTDAPAAAGVLARPGAGLRQRLLCAEIADLAWHLGDRVTVDRLALYLVLRLPGMGVHAADEAQALARAAWAWRRLDHGAVPPRDDPPALAAWLGRAPAATGDTADPALLGRPVGTEFDALAQDWARAVADQSGRHPFVQAAAAWQGWRARGLSGDAAEIEGAVLAARIAAEALRPGGLGFVPLGLGGAAALRAGGDTVARLSAWLAGIENAALRGLMECDRLAAWQAQARALTAPMSGRTPARLIDALAAWPIVSAPMLAAQTRASRAAVQRNMIRFEEMGLVRELTGQARFRFWRAAL